MVNRKRQMGGAEAGQVAGMEGPDLSIGDERTEGEILRRVRRYREDWERGQDSEQSFWGMGEGREAGGGYEQAK